MLKKILAAVSIAILLTACGETSSRELAAYEGERIEIAATMTHHTYSSDFILTINGDTVIDKRILANPHARTGPIHMGNWEGKQVTAQFRAGAVQNFFEADVYLDVFISGNYVTTLAMT